MLEMYWEMRRGSRNRIILENWSDYLKNNQAFYFLIGLKILNILLLKNLIKELV